MPPTVQLVGVATLIHGALLALVGALLVLAAPIQLATGEELAVVILGVVLGGVWALTGAAQLACGAQLLRRRWRGATIAVNLVALIVTLPMCCALTFALAVLTAVLLGQDDARRWLSEPEV